MKKTLILLVAALALPSVALAKAPHGHKGTHANHSGTHTSHSKAAPKVMYVLRGTLSSYTAASGDTSGSITIAVAHANRHGRALASQTLTIPVSAKTKISLEDGATTIADGDHGIVKVKALKKIAASDLATTLEGGSAFQVVDQGSS